MLIIKLRPGMELQELLLFAWLNHQHTEAVKQELDRRVIRIRRYDITGREIERQ
jgi:hypothetical protein